MDLPKRKHPRLKNYDYSQCGGYHITICVKDRKPILSKIIPAGNDTQRARVLLCTAGAVTDRYIQNIPKVYEGVELVNYVIMPNHVHLLLRLDPQGAVSVQTVIRSLKRMVNRQLGYSIWQESFYDVVIRNDAMFQQEWSYIDSNPDRWAEDDLFVSEKYM